jgi:hypothetical protein
LIHDDDCVKGLKVIHDGADILAESGIPMETALAMKDMFGVSGICNILGSIKMAKYLKLGPGDNVVTVATDGYDRYESVIDDLDSRSLETENFVLKRWKRDIFDKADEEDIYDFRRPEKKQQLFDQKEKDWIPFGYTKEYMDSMKHQDFWDNEYDKIKEYDEKIKEMRKTGPED